MPLSLVNEELKQQRRNTFLVGIGRLNLGVTHEAAQAELDLLGARIREEFPGESGKHHFGVAPLLGQTVGSIASILTMLLGAVGLLLLIACANVAHLSLVRASERGREFALRTAIGAARSRIVRQLMTESLILGLVGGVGGVGIAWIGVAAFVSLNPGDVPRLEEVGLDWRVLGFTLAVSVITSVAFGLAPALSSARMDPAADLKDGGRGGGTSRQRTRLRNGLVIAETSLALVLVIGAGLLINSVVRMTRVETGFDPNNVYAMTVVHPDPRSPEELSVFYRQLLDQVAGLPTVTAAGATAILPVSGDYMGQSLAFEGPSAFEGERYPVKYQQVAGDYFSAIGIPLVRGRVFDAIDGSDGPLVAVINDAMAREVFGETNPLGRRFSLGEDGLREGSFEIVGVVGNARQLSLLEAPVPELYLSFGQAPRRRMNIVVKTATPDAGVLRAMQEQRWSIRPNLPVLRPVMMRQYISGSVAGPRFYAWLLGTFAIVALALALVGIYGTLSYVVSQRAHELGVRMALGASDESVLGLVLRTSMAPVAVGIACGVGAAMAATQALESFVFGITATDPPTLGVAVISVLATALLASLVPARRATKLDPMTVLRNE